MASRAGGTAAAPPRLRSLSAGAHSADLEDDNDAQGRSKKKHPGSRLDQLDDKRVHRLYRDEGLDSLLGSEFLPEDVGVAGMTPEPIGQPIGKPV